MIRATRRTRGIPGRFWFATPRRTNASAPLVSWALGLFVVGCGGSTGETAEADTVACAAVAPRCDNPNPSSCACPDDTDGIVTNSASETLTTSNESSSTSDATTSTTTSNESTTTESTTTGNESSSGSTASDTSTGSSDSGSSSGSSSDSGSGSESGSSDSSGSSSSGTGM